MPRAAAALNHTHICTIYEIGEHEGQRFLSMELLEGETVKQRIVGGPFGLAVMLSLGMEIADVFDAPRTVRPLHRDSTAGLSGPPRVSPPRGRQACGLGSFRHFRYIESSRNPPRRVGFGRRRRWRPDW